MYKWKIDISLKSGQSISGIYQGPETDSFNVGKVLLQDEPTVAVFAIMSLDEEAQVFVLRSEVAAMGISIFEPIDKQKDM